MNRKAFIYLGILIAVGGIIAYISIFFPTIFSAFVNFLWIMLLIIVSVFLVLGFLVIMGLKQEVSAFLDVLLEGSLTIIDAIDILKKLYFKFIAMLKDFIFFVAPILAYMVGFSIYIAVMLLYKGVGKDNDVTLLTGVLTAAMTVSVGVLNLSSRELDVATWAQQVRLRFKNYFADAVEIVIFIFFLTMDMTNLFFLPKDLNVPLVANIGNNFDLMARGADVTFQLSVTIYLVTISISLEILRNLIRLFSSAVSYYKNLPKTDAKGTRMKASIRLAFADAKDDLLKFITYTTVLVLVFLIFPRLKLFAMAVASLTGLILDLLIPARLKIKRGNDLISRILNKSFNI